MTVNHGVVSSSLTEAAKKFRRAKALRFFLAKSAVKCAYFDGRRFYLPRLAGAALSCRAAPLAQTVHRTVWAIHPMRSARSIRISRSAERNAKEFYKIAPLFALRCKAASAMPRVCFADYRLCRTFLRFEEHEGRCPSTLQAF